MANSKAPLPHRIFFWKGIRKMASGRNAASALAVSLPVSTFYAEPLRRIFLADLQFRYVDPLGACKANSRRRRVAFLVVCARRRRAEFHGDVFCLSATSSMIRVMRRAFRRPCALRLNAGSARPFFTRFRSPSFAGAIKRAGSLRSLSPTVAVSPGAPARRESPSPASFSRTSPQTAWRGS